MLAWAPAVETLTRSVSPVAASWANTSALWFVSAGTRLSAIESNAVTWPSPLIAGRLNRPLMSFPWTPPLLWLTRIVDEAIAAWAGIASRPAARPAVRSTPIVRARISISCPSRSNVGTYEQEAPKARPRIRNPYRDDLSGE